jgi:hypothetical protein
MLRFSVFAVAVMFATAAIAQQRPDPRTAGELINALQAQIVLMQASMRANQEDADAMRKRLCEAIPEDKRAAECAAKAAEAK